MKGKKVLEFLILKPAFTSRNISSLGLVAIFFFVYWLAGGKVAVPNVKQGSNFGTVTNEKLNSNSASGAQAPTAFRQGQYPSNSSNSEMTREEPAGTDSEKSKQLEEKLKKLNELEERLKSLKRAKSGGE